MIALIVIGVILALILIVLLIPISVFLSFDGDFFVKVSFAKIKVFETHSAENEPKQSAETSAKQSEKENAVLKEGKQLFSFLKEKYGFMGAVKAILGFGKDVLTHIKKLLRHIKIKRVMLDITVASADAASTAIEYGKICSAAYPVLAFLNSCAKVGFKRINIKSDFEGNTPQFKFSANASLQVIFLLIAAYGVYSEYKKFVSKENFNERK